MLRTVMAPANGVRVSCRTRAWAAVPAPAMTILGRAAVVAVVGEAVLGAAAAEADIPEVGDNAGADMCRPFRWVAIMWPVCLMNPA